MRELKFTKLGWISSRITSRPAACLLGFSVAPSANHVKSGRLTIPAPEAREKANTERFPVSARTATSTSWPASSLMVLGLSILVSRHLSPVRDTCRAGSFRNHLLLTSGLITETEGVTTGNPVQELRPGFMNIDDLACLSRLFRSRWIPVGGVGATIRARCFFQTLCIESGRCSIGS